MGKVDKISISLTGEMIGDLQDAVASGEYASTSEVVREALREWKTRRSREQAAITELRQLLREADESGFTDFPGIEEVKARGRARLEAIKRR